MGKLRVKICGMKHPANIAEVCALSPDYLGFLFYEKSPRFVGEHPDMDIFSLVPPAIEKVGVFVNATAGEMLRLSDRYRIHTIQLHGNEPADVCMTLKEEGRVVVKAVPGDSARIEAGIKKYNGFVDYFLFDTPVQNYGGSGRKFEWAALESSEVPRPFFLSGGIGPGDEEAIVGLDWNGLYAVDVNSRFETEPGMKDVRLLEEFMEMIKRCQI